jgi:hypothetical protein
MQAGPQSEERMMPAATDRSERDGADFEAAIRADFEAERESWAAHNDAMYADFQVWRDDAGYASRLQPRARRACAGGRRRPGRRARRSSSGSDDPEGEHPRPAALTAGLKSSAEGDE